LFCSLGLAMFSASPGFLAFESGPFRLLISYRELACNFSVHIKHGRVTLKSLPAEKKKVFPIVPNGNNMAKTVHGEIS